MPHRAHVLQARPGPRLTTTVSNSMPHPAQSKTPAPPRSAPLRRARARVCRSNTLEEVLLKCAFPLRHAGQ
eukprot:6842443-Prorocentrum_lima.AAC.1